MRRASSPRTSTSKRRRPGSSLNDSRALARTSRRNRGMKSACTTNSTSRASSGIVALHGAPDQLGNASEMIRHRARRSLRIAACDTLEDLTMAVECRILGTSYLQRDRPLTRQPFDQPVVDGGIDRVARDRRKHIVEGDVGTLEPFKIASRGDVRVQGAAQLRDVVISAALRRKSGNADFEQRPRLLEMFGPAWLRQE